MMLSFEEARDAVRKAAFKNRDQYRQEARNRPGLPSQPEKTYKEHWTSWADFLGKEPPSIDEVKQQLLRLLRHYEPKTFIKQTTKGRPYEL